MPQRTIKLPCYDINIVIDCDNDGVSIGSGTINSSLKEENLSESKLESEEGIKSIVGFNMAIDVVEAMILAHACAGIDVESPAYLEGIETVVDKISNEFS
jgi:hypothetical protein